MLRVASPVCNVVSISHYCRYTLAPTLRSLHSCPITAFPRSRPSSARLPGRPHTPAPRSPRRSQLRRIAATRARRIRRGGEQRWNDPSPLRPRRAETRCRRQLACSRRRPACPRQGLSRWARGVPVAENGVHRDERKRNRLISSPHDPLNSARVCRLALRLSNSSTHGTGAPSTISSWSVSPRTL